MSMFTLIQNEVTSTAVGATAEVAKNSVAELNLFDLALKGGWIMIPILLLCMLTIYILIEREIVIRRAAREDKNFMNSIKEYIVQGKIDSAIKLCQHTDTPASRMIEKGITRLGRPMNDVLVAIENVGNIEISKLEKGFSLVATASGGAPMLGFLGTVTGMVQAFYDMANAGSNADISLLSGGIYEALVTTVAGLVVGIIALFSYNYLVARVDGVVHQMETKTMEFMDLLNAPGK